MQVFRPVVFYGPSKCCSHFPSAKSTFSSNFFICPFGKIQLFKKCCFLKCEENVHLLNGAHRGIFIKPQRVEKSSRWIIPQLPNCPSLLLKTLNFILLINQQSFTPNQPSFTPDPSFHIKF